MTLRHDAARGQDQERPPRALDTHENPIATSFPALPTFARGGTMTVVGMPSFRDCSLIWQDGLKPSRKLRLGLQQLPKEDSPAVACSGFTVQILRNIPDLFPSTEVGIEKAHHERHLAAHPGKQKNGNVRPYGFHLTS
jgi:hypothetical protein